MSTYLETATASAEILPIDIARVFSDSTELIRLLELWQLAGWIRPLELSFCKTLDELASASGEAADPQVLLLAVMLSHQVGRGHVGIDLAELLEQPATLLALPPDEQDWRALNPLQRADLRRLTPSRLLAGYSVGELQARLKRSLLLSDGREVSPLVLEGTLLYLRRFWLYERRIAAGIQARLRCRTGLEQNDGALARTLQVSLERLFVQQQGSIDYQKCACALAARSQFALITGGPGTGKTTTVVKLLAALQSVAAEDPQQYGRKYRIRLAAPTGKAAARLNESIRRARDQLPLAELPGQVRLEDIPAEVTTVHRLLGTRANSRRFRHDSDNPLLIDILVVDEASMLDVSLLASILDALPEQAQLILIGDKDQLASVEAGAVLGELCSRASAGHYRPALADWLAQVAGYPLPASLIDPEGSALDQAVAMLRQSYRFGEESGIRKLADAVNRNAELEQRLAECKAQQYADLLWIEPPTDSDQTGSSLTAQLIEHCISGSPVAFCQASERAAPEADAVAGPVGFSHYLSLLNNHSLGLGSARDAWDQLAAQLLSAYSQFQLLTPLRSGDWGVENLNQQLAQALFARGLISRPDGWYSGRPVMITRNDYALGLMNGDVGIAIEVPWGPVQQGHPSWILRVAFPGSDQQDSIRWIAPSRLPDHETVYAMTVHKSQGSEFSHACLVVPDRISPVITRELIYTAITRAKHWFSIYAADPTLFAKGAQARVQRFSGLREKIASEEVDGD